jgi:hypothetical protein
VRLVKISYTVPSEIHHIDHNRKNNSEANLNCHRNGMELDLD